MAIKKPRTNTKNIQSLLKIDTLKKVLFSLIVALLTTFNTFAQLYEVSLDQKIDASPLIIEGKVIEQKCFRTKYGDIYTANKIQLSGTLKGNYDKDVLTVTTWGGELDGEMQTWTHLLTLRVGEKGIFFLEPTRVESIDNPDFAPAFDVYAGVQGFLQQRTNDHKAIFYAEPFHAYFNPEAEIFAYIARKVNQPFAAHGEEDTKKSGIRFHFTDINFDGTSISFKIYVNSLYGEKKLFKSGVAMGYNSEFFGENVAVNNHLQLTEDGISLPAAYTLAKQDVTAEKVKITCNFSGNASEYFTINANETLLGKGKLVIEDSLQDPGIAFNYNEILSLNQYWDGNAALNFDTVIVDGEWKPFEQLAVTIDSIRPLSLRAGTDDLLTIYGSGFGTTQGNSYVEFTNAFEGTVNGVDWIQPLLTDYNFWSETKIEVFVPSVAKDGVYTEYAGSGKIRVKIVNNSVKTSSESLNVRFAVDNRARADIGQSELKRKKVRLIGDFSEDNSGYVLYYSENFKNLSGAVPAFERALCTWIQTDNINFKIKDYPDIAPFYQQYACQIILSDLLPDGNPSSTKAVTTKEYFSACLDGNGSILKFALKKFDIYFRQFEDWYVNQEYDPTLPFSFWENNHDLESFALHELGHAQLLLHVNQNDDIMYFEVLTPNRTPHTNDIEGGDYIKQISNIAEPNCTINPMIQLDDCTSSYLEALNIKKQIEYWPNPSFNNLFIESSKIIENIKIFDLLGRVQLETFPNSKSISINVSMLNQGIYFGVLKEGNNFHQIKFEKL